MDKKLELFNQLWASGHFQNVAACMSAVDDVLKWSSGVLPDPAEMMAKSQEMNAEGDPAAKWQVFRKEIEKPVGLVAEGKKATLDSVAQMLDQMTEADLVNNIKYPLWWYGRQYKITIEKWEGTDEPISR